MILSWDIIRIKSHHILWVKVFVVAQRAHYIFKLIRAKAQLQTHQN